jgi:hypothetical protein
MFCAQADSPRPMAERSVVPVTTIMIVWNVSALSEKVKLGQSGTYQYEMQSTDQFEQHGRTVRQPWPGSSPKTTYGIGKTPGQFVVQWLKTHRPCPNSFWLMRTVRRPWSDDPSTLVGRSAQEHRDRCASRHFWHSHGRSGHLAHGPPTPELSNSSLCINKRLWLLKIEVLLVLLQMHQFILYKALSFTPIKFIDPS